MNALGSTPATTQNWSDVKATVKNKAKGVINFVKENPAKAVAYGLIGTLILGEPTVGTAVGAATGAAAGTAGAAKKFGEVTAE